MTAFSAILNRFICQNLLSGVPCTIVLIFAWLGIFSLSGCSKSEMMLPGERIAVTQQTKLLPVNPQAFSEGAGLTAALTTLTASHAGLNAGHAGGHLALELPLNKLPKVILPRQRQAILHCRQMRLLTRFINRRRNYCQ